MTVTSQVSRNDYNGNGVSTSFPVTFRFLESNQLKVIRTVIATGVTTTLVLNGGGSTGYTVTGAGQPNGGTVTTNVPVAGVTPTPALQERISILRNVPVTQEIDYIANDPFPAESHERGLDKLTMIVQQQGEITQRAVTLPPQSMGVSTELPGVVPLNLLRWNSSGTALENAVPPEIATLADGAVTDNKVSPIAGIQSDKLSYLQAGTGAIPQSVRERLRNEVWASDFGAVADFNEGTSTGTDNTTAFAAAITYLNSIGGGTLKLGRGKYMGRIRVPYSNIMVEGQGQWATKLFNVGNQAVFEIDCTAGDVQYCGLKGVLIQNRSKPVYTSADGIFINSPTAVTGSSFLTFENVYVFNMRHNIFIRGRTIWNTWKDINMSGAIQNGLTIDAYDNAAQQLWLNCRFGASAMHGLLLSHTFAGFPTVGWTFVGCTFEHNILNGIRLTGTISGPQSWKFISCYCEENASGISVGGSGGLQKAHFFCDTPEILGLSIDAGSMFGAKPGDPALDYHIYCNTGGVGVYYGEVMNVRFGVATVNDIFWAKNLILGKNFYSTGSNADWGQGSIRLDDLAAPSGTITPALLFGGAGTGMTYGNRKGNWVRHGNLVHFTIYVSLTAKGSSTGATTVTGLPVTALNVANLFQAVSVHADQLAAGVSHVQARIVPNTTSIEISKFAAGASASTTDADFGNFSALAISGSYLVR